jgi:hypothetical protein
MRAGLLCGHSDRWIALDCYPIQFLEGPDNYDALMLSRESPTPRARTYADRLSENSREVTLVAEADHSGERQPAIAQLFLGLRDALLNEPLVRLRSDVRFLRRRCR